jgi:hypothetical protein
MSSSYLHILLFWTFASYPYHVQLGKRLISGPLKALSGSKYTIHLQQHLKGLQTSTRVFVWQRQPSGLRVIINLISHFAVCFILSDQSPSNH